jgi:hypothetical protein
VVQGIKQAVTVKLGHIVIKPDLATAFKVPFGGV